MQIQPTSRVYRHAVTLINFMLRPLHLSCSSAHCPAVLGAVGGKHRSEVSVEPRHLHSLKGPEPPIRLHLTRDAEVAQDEGTIPHGLVIVKEHSVYLRHQLAAGMW